MGSALILAGRVSAQLVFEPQLVGSSSGAAVSPRLDRGDLDGDGDLDVVFSTDVDSVAFGYEVFLNDGTGDLAFSSAVGVSQAIKGLRLTDLDDDGDVDLLTAQGPSINLRRGAGNGTFAMPEVVYTAAAGNVTQLEVADLTGDELPDLIAIQAGVVLLLPGQGDGTVLAPVTIANVAPQLAYAARPADLDADGVTDVVVLARDFAQPTQPVSVAHVYLGTLNGGFSFVESYIMGDLADIALGALDDDGLPDLACASKIGVSVWMSQGAGDFETPLVLATSAFDSGVAVADFDADGHDDVASVCKATSELVFWHSDGVGGLTEGLRLSGADPLGITGKSPLYVRPLLPAEMNGDGKLDLLRTAGDEFGQVHVSVFPNHTYAPTEPFLDQGHALADPGFAGMLLATPILLAEGTMQAGTPVHLHVLRHGVESDHAWLVLGSSALNAPLFGGTLVPSPNMLVGPLVLPSPDSSIDISTTMPAGVPSGSQFWMQAWFVPTNGFQDHAATSGVRLTAP
jgi:hypothetical protein